MVSLAGALAEKRFSGRFDHRSADYDRHQAAYTGDYIAGGRDPRPLHAYLAYCQAATRAMLDIPMHWAAVEGLARALLEQRSVTGDEAVAVMLGALRSHQAQA
jgi:hypothetical protein